VARSAQHSIFLHIRFLFFSGAILPTIVGLLLYRGHSFRLFCCLPPSLDATRLVSVSPSAFTSATAGLHTRRATVKAWPACCMPNMPREQHGRLLPCTRPVGVRHFGMWLGGPYNCIVRHQTDGLDYFAVVLNSAAERYCAGSCKLFHSLRCAACARPPTCSTLLHRIRRGHTNCDAPPLLPGVLPLPSVLPASATRRSSHTRCTPPQFDLFNRQWLLFITLGHMYATMALTHAGMPTGALHTQTQNLQHDGTRLAGDDSGPCPPPPSHLLTTFPYTPHLYYLLHTHALRAARYTTTHAYRLPVTPSAGAPTGSTSRLHYRAAACAHTLAQFPGHLHTCRGARCRVGSNTPLDYILQTAFVAPSRCCRGPCVVAAVQNAQHHHCQPPPDSPPATGNRRDACLLTAPTCHYTTAPHHAHHLAHHAHAHPAPTTPPLPTTPPHHLPHYHHPTTPHLGADGTLHCCASHLPLFCCRRSCHTRGLLRAGRRAP